jgi:hypothetical protein
MTEDIFTLNGKRSLTIVLDRTSSMAEVIQSMVDFLPKYLIRRYAQDIDQMSLVTFDDHYHGKPLNVGATSDENDQPAYNANVLDAYGPTSNLEEYAYWLKTVKTGWGDDHPEAIACALAAARTLDPEASIWLVTDAVPHGAGSGYTDGYPYGCPCSIQLDTTGVNVLLTYTNEQDQAFWETKCPGRVVVVSDLKEKLQEPVEELAYA